MHLSLPPIHVPAALTAFATRIDTMPASAFAMAANAAAETGSHIAAVVPQVTSAQAITSSATIAGEVATGATAVKAPLEAAARAAQHNVQRTGLQRTVAFVGRATAGFVIGASVLQGVQVAHTEGGGALLHTQKGRSAVLGAVGGSLLLVPTPVTEVGAAVVLGASAVNAFGGLKVLDHPSR